jgi:hypothetical protein
LRFSAASSGAAARNASFPRSLFKSSRYSLPENWAFQFAENSVLGGAALSALWAEFFSKL